ncbi:unnamed protein product [Owenia fusiformis]|uniref:Mediator of RNA polymerase II transcription subunit 28 n=1 Tax=Owenia fusiformis TaxID=6347 RepID=A0A8J1XHB1_OWEFU|nr:unnamed protein product [Owenia fusiformis]
MASNVVDDLEASFQNAYSSLTSQEHFNINDSEEVKVGVEQCLQKFLENARQTESWFLQRRLILSHNKPELIVKEEIQDLKAELIRKEQLIAKHHDKLQQWQSMLRQQVPVMQQSNPQMHHHMQQQQLQQQQKHLQSPQRPLVAQQMNQPMVRMPTPQQHASLPSTPTNPHIPVGQQSFTGMPGPLAYLEQTTSNIGIGEQRR